MIAVTKDWECERCGRLLGKYKGNIVCVHIKGHIYTTGCLWAQTECPNPRCGHKNIIVFTEPTAQINNN